MEKIKEWDAVVKLIQTDSHRRRGERQGAVCLRSCKDFVDITVLVTVETLWGIDHLTAFVLGNQGLGPYRK